MGESGERARTGTAIACSYATAIVLEESVANPRTLLLQRAKPYLRGSWGAVAGAIEAGETAWQAALREIDEETGLVVSRLFATDFVEQYYDATRDQVVIVPAFVAYVDAAQPVRLNDEHSAHRWTTIAEARELAVFGGRRRLYEEVEREFIERVPSPWHQIQLD